MRQFQSWLEILNIVDNMLEDLDLAHSSSCREIRHHRSQPLITVAHVVNTALLDLWTTGTPSASSWNAWCRCGSRAQWVFVDAKAGFRGLRFHVCVLRVGTLGRTHRCAPLQGQWRYLAARGSNCVLSKSSLRGFLTCSCVNLVTNLNQSQAGRGRPGK